jgi:hypothetical protein
VVNAGSGQVRAASHVVSEALLISDVEDTNNATLSSNLLVQHRLSSGTPAAGMGVAMTFAADTNVAVRNMAQIYAQWANATDATRQGYIRLIAIDSVGGREGMRVTANGSNVQVGFFGSAGSTKLTISGVRSGTLAQLQSVVASMLAGLEAHGLWVDATT